MVQRDVLLAGFLIFGEIIVDLDNLLNNTLSEFFLECVGNKIEEVSELPEMMKDIGYLESRHG